MTEAEWRVSNDRAHTFRSVCGTLRGAVRRRVQFYFFDSENVVLAKVGVSHVQCELIGKVDDDFKQVRKIELRQRRSRGIAPGENLGRSPGRLAVQR